LKPKFIYLINFIFSPKVLSLIIKLSNDRLTYLDKFALFDLASAVKKTQKLDGIIIETGTALGGSAILIAKTKQKKTYLHLYDTFEQIPPPGKNDSEDVHQRYYEIVNGKATGLGTDLYYGYQTNLLEKVKNSFQSYNINTQSNNVIFHKGLFQDTLNINQPIKLAHIDCDWYDSVKICLEEIVPNLKVNGIIIIDDYDHWSGSKKAVDEFFSKQENKENFQFSRKSRLQIKRIK